MPKIGFTGTQHGMTPSQTSQLQTVLREFFLLEDFPRGSEFHHGLCIGADAEAAKIAMDLCLEVHAWQGSIPHKQVKDDSLWTILHDPMNNLNRNLEIILATDILIAAPSSNTEQQRSGTWATVRRARVRNKPVIMLAR